ncbi:folate-binding protein YgfZ [Granulicella mallensis]|uniref:Folate-binding protein YgfZ n=1 Tax=Granulicella mallensis TaxID=940614 RepID=A0A7W7ZQP8_9BACT|nr:folate-binding protein YgfZ [Granulicella mallensis]MBB5064343.1 folate-binding protein YgfZ [Granulicella mallensis]
MAENTQHELHQILENAAFAPLHDRAFLRITGPDATRWLNGMVTNSVQSLAPGEGNYNFLLNAQGRIQGDGTIYRDGDEFLLETSTSQVESIQQHLDRFIIMDDVELSPAYTEKQGLLLVGAKTPAILAASELPTLDPLHLSHAKSLLLLTPAAGSVPRYELWDDPASLAVLRESLSNAGAVEVSVASLEQLRLIEATPRFSQDIRDRDLPQETAQAHALHFNKGCYLGQEIVERIRSRGQVHRTFTAFRLTGDLPTLPAPIEANGKPVGELTSAAVVPLPEGPTLLALGYIRREALDTHQPLTYAGGTAIPRSPGNS